MKFVILEGQKNEILDDIFVYQVRQNKVAPKVFRCFLSNRLEF